MGDEIPKTAEEYLRNKYGAYRGSFSWRDEESAFNAGVESAPHALKAKLESAESRIKELEADLAEAKKDQARYQFVRDMTPTDFGNLPQINGYFDHQIDAAIASIQEGK